MHSEVPPQGGKRGRKQSRPDPGEGPVAEFAHRLWELKEAAGDPSYERMRTELGAAASKSALSAAARGRELPSWDTTWEFVRSLAVGKLGEDEERTRRDWQARWERARDAEQATDEVPTGDVTVLPDEDKPARSRRQLFTVAAVVVVVLLVAAGVGYLALRPENQGTPQTPPAAGGHWPVPGDASEFVRDVSIPDHTRVTVGQQFVKTWEIRNTGSVRWVDRYLQRVGGSESTADCRTPARVPVPTTEPGNTVQIAVPVNPHTAGVCKVYWKMVDEAGEQVMPAARGVFFEVVVTP